MSFSPLKPPVFAPNIVLPELVLPAILPDDVGALKMLLQDLYGAHQAALLAVKEQVTREAHDYIIRMVEQAKLARHRMFGSSSDQLAGQGRIFDEAEALVQTSSDADDVAPIPAADEAAGHDKKPGKVARGKRTALPAGLQRVDVVHDVPESERTCPCGTLMVEIGQDVSEQLDIVPMQVRVLRHLRKRYACPDGARAPVTAPMPPQPLPKTNASINFLAMLLVLKFVDGLPLARIEYVLARHGATVPRQTLARWVIGAARLLQPLHNLMRDILLDAPFIHMDETVVQVLKEDGKAATSNSYMWVQTGGPPDRPIVIYDYDPSRSGDVPARLLQGYQGYLMTDGYDGYNQLIRNEDIVHLACWAHVRRRFVDAVRVQPKGNRGKADEAVALIGKLYGIERDNKDAADGDRLQARQQLSLPALATLHDWMEATLPGVPPSSALGSALAYMKKYWSRLTGYTERGDLPIDNNRVENSIRPFVVGRKGWLFSDTPAGARSSAVIYSLMQTAKANGIEPYAWLCTVLHDLPAAKTIEDVEALLPWNLHKLDLTSEVAP